MASFIPLYFIATALLILPACSLTCTSQTFTQKNTFTNCTDLPVLKAYLHWTYDPTAKPKPTLSVAFIAPPAKPDGWVAWALNPTGTGMAGAQSLVAFKQSNGSVIVKTYNISSYNSIVESKLFYDVLDKKAEFSGGVIRIFAKLALPSDTTELNQVWQVGAKVNNGMPEKHDFSPDNLNSKGPLSLVSKASADTPTLAPAPEPTSGNGNGNGGRNGNENGGSSRIGVCGALVLLLAIPLLGF
ncbi:Cytochrome b561 and DOMON domain-containing protein [Abeliophyllum distichum]|uniref:Cytochrome b561 and DOMON domain-containing protein n=1 Tax=Abeliophyllum distichum TaxID=126358 RepID=A0ABD1Q4E7_9LAMI